MSDVTWIVVGDIAAATAAGAALWSLRTAKKFGEDTAEKLGAAVAAQKRSAELLGEVADTLERTVLLIDVASRRADEGRALEAERATVEARPRLTVQTKGLGGDASIDVRAVNSGGAAVPACLIVTTRHGRIYGGTWEIPAHSGGMAGGVNRLPGQSSTGNLCRVIAKDINGTWWDQQSGQRVDDHPPDGATANEVLAWWAARVLAEP